MVYRTYYVRWPALLKLFGWPNRDRNSSVGIATRYRLDGPEIESRWGGEIFPTRPHRAWGPPSFQYNGYRVSFPGVKRPGRGVDLPPHLAPRLKKEYSYTSTPPLGLRGLFWGELYLYLLASGTQVCGFKPGRSRSIFTGVKILSMPYSGGEVKESLPCPSFAACKRT